MRGTVWLGVSDTVTPPGVQDLNRPLLVISNDKGNESSNPTVIVIPITSKCRKGAFGINAEVHNNKGEVNVALCNQIQTVHKSTLVRYMFSLTESEMSNVEKSVKYAMSLN